MTGPPAETTSTLDFEDLKFGLATTPDQHVNFTALIRHGDTIEIRMTPPEIAALSRFLTTHLRKGLQNGSLTSSQAATQPETRKTGTEGHAIPSQQSLLPIPNRYK